MKRSLLFPLSAALALFALSPSLASADDAWERAKAFFKAGEAAYGAGDFSAASQAFGEAYALAPRPQILFSMAQAERKQYFAQRQLQDLQDSVKHYRLYLEQVPKGGRRADAADALAELEAAAARAPASAPVDPGSRRTRTRLMVTPSVKEAVVTLDGTPHEEQPLIAEVTPGKHRIKISAKGYFDDEREVTSVEGTLVAVEVPLREQPAQLALKAPGGAEVSVDGRPYGTAPLAALELPSGAHTLTITRTGKRPVLRNLNLERGSTTSLAIGMRDTSQRTGAYAVLGVAAGAALAGGALGVAAVLKENEAKDVLSQAGQHTIVASQLGSYNAALDVRDRLRTAAAATLGAAGALGIVGVTLFAFDNPSIQREDLGPRSGTQSPRSPGASSVAATFVPLPGGGAVFLRGQL